MPDSLIQILSPANLILFVVILTRISGLVAGAPLFSTYPIPPQIKLWMVASITFVLYPIIQAKAGFIAPASIPGLTVILLKEFMIGYTIGFLANIIFVGLQMGANVFSVQMGLAMAQAMDPASGSMTLVMSRAYTIMASMVFICSNAHHQLFSIVYKTFSTMPIGYEFIVNGTLTKEVIFMSGQMFIIAFGVALPIFATLLMTDLLLGFTAKMMPQMNIFMVAMPFKILIGIGLFLLLIPSTMEYIVKVFDTFLQGLGALF